MTVEIREFRYGDMGAIVTAQARYYAVAEGWSGGMEALLLEVTGEFVRRHVPGRSNCWIAERDGEPVGSIFCFDAGDGVAQLRLTYVDSSVRGLGVGLRPGRTLRRFRPGGGLPRAHAVDPQQPAPGPRALCQGRLRANLDRGSPRIWSTRARGDVGASARYSLTR